MAAATVEDMVALDALVSSLASVEQTLHQVSAARDGLLALASRLALSIAEHGDGVDEADLTLRSVAAELAGVLRVSDRTVQRRMADAELKVDLFPTVWAAQGAGRISAAHARVIVDAGMHIEDPEARAAYSGRVLEFAEDESPNRLRPIAERLAEQYQARSLEERHRQAREKRAVWVKDQPDGMAELGLLGPAALVHGAFDRITAMAKAVRAAETRAQTAHDRAGMADADAPGAGTADAANDRASTADADSDRSDTAADADAEHAEHAECAECADATGAGDVRASAGRLSADPRTLSQTRADLAVDLLLTGTPAGHDTPDGLLGAITASVSVTVPVFTLMGVTGLDTAAAELAGRCPIDPATARRLAGAASGWDRVLTHPISAAMLAVDRYRPGEPLKRHLRARDQRCRFPGCGMPVRDSDLDHTEDAAFGGPTQDDNLAALCRRHHVLKHHTPWHVEQLDDGLLEWTSPTGRTYTDEPPPQNTITFTDATRDGDPRADHPEDPWATTPEALLAPF